jgi:regulator of sirC expression with transglutaminase-like and TPR domain
MNSSSARQYFYQEIQQPDELINLAKAALYIAQEEYLDLDSEEYLNSLDMMAAEVEERLTRTRYPLKVIKTLNHYIFEDLKFAGNKENYYDSRNSFLNDVIDSRLGIPITLSLVYLEVARRIDFPMIGVGMPGHFLLRPDIPDMDIFVDAFNNGEVMFPEDCHNRLEEIFQQPITFKPEFLAPVTNKQFLLRLLNNLKQIYIQNRKFEKALTVVDKMLLIFPGHPEELRDRGLIYYQLGQFLLASQDLQHYLAIAPYAEDAYKIRQLLQQIS